MRTNYFIIPFLSMLLFSSCNYLDYDETSGLKTKEDMYKYFDTSKQMLTHVYSFMPQGSSLFSGSISTIAMLDCASDDAEFGAVADDIQLMNNGGWSAINTYDDSWSLYNGIRAANSFIIEIAQADFTRYEHNGSYQNWMKQLQYFPYEARVLRAYYFFELARRYGDIAMPLAVLTEEEANTIGKTAFADVIQFIVDECDAAATDGHLPESYAGEPGQEIGRVTKGFAMALKSKALLYAASELHNPSMDQEAWKKSAMAALDIINLGLYSLDPDGCANNHLPATMSVVAIGLSISIVLGLGLAVLMDISEIAEKALYPLIIASQTIPTTALAPLFVLWFGYGIWSKVLVTVLITFFPITITVFDGFKSVKTEMEELLFTFGASKRQIFFKLKIPAVLPCFFSAIKMAVPMSIIGAAIGEWLGAQSGLGYFSRRMMTQLDGAGVFAPILLLSVVAMFFTELVAILEKRLIHWRND